MANILIVEDDLVAANQIGRHLAAVGHRCAYSATGDKVFEFLKTGQVDLILLDIMLPGMSGFEICRQVRRDPKLFTVPILMMSAMNNEEEVEHGLAQGADDYVVKPLDVQSLLPRIQALLDLAQSNQNVDEATSMPGTGAIKREIQKLISRREVYAALYFEVLGIREFARNAGSEGRMATVKSLAQVLSRTREAMQLKKAVLGHMGGGHFVCITTPETATPYAERVLSAWNEGIPGIYQKCGVAKPKPDAPEAQSQLKLLARITNCDRREQLTPQQVFEVLTQLRNKGMENKTGGLYLDRRS